MKSNKNFNFKTIESFEDACRKEGIDSNVLPDVSMIAEEFRDAIINCYKLFIIFKAINDGWEADWSDRNQLKYFPWFRVNSAGSGFDFSCSLCNYDGANTDVGSRLCTYSSDAAIYIGEQFSEEYAKFFLKQ